MSKAAITYDSARELPLMEHFYTVQGEGYHQGKAAYFIRMQGCDIGCVWCDVPESWKLDTKSIFPLEELVREASAVPADIAVITGGEALMWDLGPLTAALKKAGLKTHLETSGAYPLSGEWDWICVSPKRFKRPNPELLAAADELKTVIFHQNDLRWAEGFTSDLRSDCKRFLQPEWSREKEMLPLIIDYVKQHPEWEVSLQSHKYMNIP